MTVNFYNECVRNYADRLYRFALKSLPAHDDAQEMVQESFIRLWQHRDSVDEQKVKSWLFTTVSRLIADHYRRAARHRELKPDVRVGAETNQYTGLAEALDAALATLPEIQRQVVLLRDYEGYSYAEIAEICGLNESQVKVYIFRARAALKQFIGNQEAVV